MIRFKGFYYAFGTTGNARKPDGRIFTTLRSRDLVEWETLGGALVPPSPNRRVQYRAPEVTFHKGIFYLYYAMGGTEPEKSELRVATSRRPEGPYADIGNKLADCESNRFTIDAFPFRDDDGQWYLFYARNFTNSAPGEHPGTAIVVDRLVDMTRSAGDCHVVLRARYDWTLYEANRRMDVYDATFDWHTIDQPFFLYYPMSHVHGPIVPTPDSKAGAGKDELYRDNVEYMDKLVGKLVAELDRLHLREKTLVLFAGDNGTARFGVDIATVNGRSISGMKGTMLEGGSRVPLVVNWPGVTPAGWVNRDLVDFSDFFATFAEFAGAPLPEGVTLDSHSFAAQIKGQKGTPRDWVYVELNGKSYARNARCKLTNGGELFDLSEAPYKKIAVSSTTTDAAAIAARKQLQ